MKAVLLTLTTLLAAATLAGVLVGTWGGDQSQRRSPRDVKEDDQ